MSSYSVPESSRCLRPGAPQIRLAAVAGFTAIAAIALVVLGREVAHQPLALRHLLENGGPYGALLLLATFGVGPWLRIPGLLLVAAAVAVYGPLVGGALSLVGALLALSLSFLGIRSLAAASAVRFGDLRLMRWAGDRVARRPVTVVALLRVVFWLSPTVTGALALSPIRFREYLLGSLLGLLPSIALAALLLERGLPHLG